MKLIVGLGNPGSQYERTRHNVGFMCVDLFARKHGAGNFRLAHESFVADTLVGGEKVILLKPQTYMNLSGRAVASAMQFYKIVLTDILVVLDDIALPCGTIRIRPSGSAGGHNGLKDIQRAMTNFALEIGKTGEGYARLRVGIDAPGRVPQVDYVLQPFSSVQRPLIEGAVEKGAEAAGVWVTGGVTAAMNKFNAVEKAG